METPLNILVVGSLPPPIGGTSVSLLHLIQQLHTRQDVRVHVVDTAGTLQLNLFNKFSKYLGLVRDIYRKSGSSDVLTVHVASSSLAFLGATILIVGALKKKPVLVRKFGGTDYNKYTLLKRLINRYVLKKSDHYLAQTKSLVDTAIRDGINRVSWYPTSRPMPDLHKSKTANRVCRKFIYLGKVRRSKGIVELIEAAERFTENVLVDVYGSLHSDINEKLFSGLRNSTYHGILSPEKVHETLRKYDALILPTYHPGEGYAGVILEAYSVGIPVISTRWQAIPEIVDETTGILIEPKNSNEIYMAMTKLVEDTDLYNRLRTGVREVRERFSSERWTDEFVAVCSSLAGRTFGSRNIGTD